MEQKNVHTHPTGTLNLHLTTGGFLQTLRSINPRNEAIRARHEISGTVVDVGRDVRAFRKGDRVATVQRFHICGACRYCRTGRETLCPERKFTGDLGMICSGEPIVPPERRQVRS